MNVGLTSFLPIAAHLTLAIAGAASDLETTNSPWSSAETIGGWTHQMLMGDDSARDKLLAYARDEKLDFTWRATALASLGRLRTSANLTAICSFLNSPSVNVRLMGFYSLPPEVMQGIDHTRLTSDTGSENVIAEIKKRASAFPVESAKSVSEEYRLVVRLVKETVGGSADARAQLSAYAKEEMHREDFREMAVRTLGQPPTRENLRSVLSFLNSSSGAIRTAAFYTLPERVRHGVEFEYTRRPTETEYIAVVHKLEMGIVESIEPSTQQQPQK